MPITSFSRGICICISTIDRGNARARLAFRSPRIQEALNSSCCLFQQNDVMNVGGELNSGDAGYFSTSPQMAYQPATTTSTATQQLTPQTPNTPTIILTGRDDATTRRASQSLGIASSKLRNELTVRSIGETDAGFPPARPDAFNIRVSPTGFKTSSYPVPATDSPFVRRYSLLFGYWERSALVHAHAVLQISLVRTTLRIQSSSRTSARR